MSKIDGSGSAAPASSRVGQVVRTPKTAELIAADLRRQIVRGELKASESLPSETHLMEQYGVSRPTLREAFRILETETLLSIRRGARGGAQVMTPDISVAGRYVGLLLQIQGATIDDVYEARMVSEPVCARLLAYGRTDTDLVELRAVIEDLDILVDAGVEAAPDPGRWSGLTHRFHQLIVQRCGSNTLAAQAAVLQDIVAAHLHVRVAQSLDPTESPERFQRVIRAYEKLLSLVESRDGEGAEQHWRAHMEAAATYLFRGELANRPVVDLFT